MGKAFGRPRHFSGVSQMTRLRLRRTGAGVSSTDTRRRGGGGCMATEGREGARSWVVTMVRGGRTAVKVALLGGSAVRTLRKRADVLVKLVLK